MLDLVIRDALIYDGTGGMPYQGDIGIRGDRIAALGKLPPTDGVEELHAGGFSVCPGFIDIHRHSDFTLLIDGRAESAVRQGVTTEVIGNCGHSCAPVDRTGAVHMFGYRAKYGPKLAWRSFGEYRALLAGKELGVNVAPLVGHGAIRQSVMGPEPRSATQTQVRRMCRQLAKSLDEGAFGLSTGLEYSPGNIAKAQELRALVGLAAKQHSLHATHIRNRDVRFRACVAEVLALTRVTGGSLQISHIAPRAWVKPSEFDAALDDVNAAVDTGLEVACDMFPYTWGMTTLANALPPSAYQGGIRLLLQRLSSPRNRAQFRRYRGYPQAELIRRGELDRLVLLDSEGSKHLNGRSFREICALENTDPHSAIFDILEREGSEFYGVTWLSETFDLKDILRVMSLPYCMFASDSLTVSPDGPLAGMQVQQGSYGYAARSLEIAVSSSPQTLSFSEAVSRMTNLPARKLGLTKRGAIQVGAYADLVVLSPKAFTDRSAPLDPAHSPGGVRHVLVNGAIALRDGVTSGVLGGRVLSRGET
jgi:N-acyl-D-amino-acid deacylase